MTRRRTTRTGLIAAICFATALAVGCSQRQADDLSAAAPVEAYAGRSLAAGDALGRQVFADEGRGATRFAVLRQVDEAIALAEAKEASGEYDAWYASFIRPGDNEQHDGSAIAGVDPDENE